MLADAKIELRTKRLVLRPMWPSDAEPLFALFADWDVIRWLSTPPWPYTIADAREFLRSLERGLTNATFAITLDAALIGGIDVRMNHASRSQSGRGPNLGYWLGRPYWGRGYMTEAAREFLAHVFAAGIGDTVYSGGFADNAASLRVQEKLGFARDGETMLYAKPRGSAFLHVNTRLERDQFDSTRRDN